MSRQVFCRKYQTEMEGLDMPPFPGQKGLDLFEHVSKKAWQEWLTHQTLLINEKRLNMMEMGTRVYLSEQMQLFLSGGQFDHADGFVPKPKS